MGERIAHVILCAEPGGGCLESEDPASGRFEFGDGSGVVIFGLPFGWESKIRKTFPRIRTERDFEFTGEIDWVNSEAVRMGREWWRGTKASALLCHRGVNAGDALQIAITYYLLGPLRKIALLQAVLKREKAKKPKFWIANKGSFRPAESVLDSAGDLAGLWFEASPVNARQGVTPARNGFFCEWARFVVRALMGLAALFAVRARTGGNGRTIVFSSDIKHVWPVMRRLSQEPLKLIHVREMLDVRHFFDFYQAGIEHCGLGFSRDSIRQKSLESALGDAICSDKPFCSSGVDLWPLIGCDFLNRFTGRITDCLDRINRVSEWISRRRPNVIIFDEDTCPFNKIMALIAADRGIPTLVIQHGIPFPTIPIAQWPLSCSVVAAWGPYSAGVFRGWGIDESKIEVMGAPRYDSIVEIKKQESPYRAKVVRDLNLDPNKKIIVLATDPFHESDRADFVGVYLTQHDLTELIEMTLRAMDGNADAQLVIKLHPRDREAAYTSELVKGLGSPARIIQKYVTQDLLMACDALVASCSTVVIEAMLFGKPVITVNPTGGRDLQPYAENGGAVKVTNAGELSLAIKTLTSDTDERRRLLESAEKGCDRYVANRDGSATERVARWIKLAAESVSKDPVCVF